MRALQDPSRDLVHAAMAWKAINKVGDGKATRQLNYFGAHKTIQNNRQRNLLSTLNKYGIDLQFLFYILLNGEKKYI